MAQNQKILPNFGANLLDVRNFTWVDAAFSLQHRLSAMQKQSKASGTQGKGLGSAFIWVQEAILLANSAPFEHPHFQHQNWRKRGWGHRYEATPTSLLWADTGGTPGPPGWRWSRGSSLQCLVLQCSLLTLVLPTSRLRGGHCHSRKGVRWSAGRLANIIQQGNKKHCHVTKNSKKNENLHLLNTFQKISFH